MMLSNPYSAHLCNMCKTRWNRKLSNQCLCVYGYQGGGCRSKSNHSVTVTSNQFPVSLSLQPDEVKCSVCECVYLRRKLEWNGYCSSLRQRCRLLLHCPTGRQHQHQLQHWQPPPQQQPLQPIHESVAVVVAAAEQLATVVAWGSVAGCCFTAPLADSISISCCTGSPLHSSSHCSQYMSLWLWWWRLLSSWQL